MPKEAHLVTLGGGLAARAQKQAAPKPGARSSGCIVDTAILWGTVDAPVAVTAFARELVGFTSGLP